MPRFDYRCPKCGNVVEMNAPLWEGAEMIPVCVMPGCTPEYPAMEKLPAAPNFTIKGFSEKNGYSK